VIEQAFAALEPVLGLTAACALSGKSRAGVHRHRHRAPVVLGPRPAPAPHPAALTVKERARVLTVLQSPRFVDKAPAQVWATLLDQGVYLCSISTMYRLLRECGEVRERRRQAAHAARARPELVARAPCQVFTWDITKLKGPVKGVYYDLYVMIDIYSRYVVHWQVHARESAEPAEQFIAAAIAANGGQAPAHVHADRGTSMTSKPVAALLADLNIAQSHSRPRVSNDNPYSKAQFRTLKYCPAFPQRFGSLTHARAFCREFFSYYNHEHRHSGIGLHTPASFHLGTAGQVRTERAHTLQAAYAANPSRFRRRPIPPSLPKAVWINEPVKEEPNSDTEQVT
jgi:putative transposase